MLTTFPRRHLMAVSHFAANRDIRYYLLGVFVEVLPDHTRLVATDGNVLGLMRHVVDNPCPFSVIIPLDIIAIAVKLKLDKLVLECQSGAWTLAGIPFKPVDGRFPDYRRVVQSSFSGQVMSGFNPEFIARFAKAGRDLQRRDYPIIRQNGNGAATVHFYAFDDFIGVLMVYNHFTAKSPDLGVPTWGRS